MIKCPMGRATWQLSAASLRRTVDTCARTTRRDTRRRFGNIETPLSRCASGLEPEHELEVAFLSRAVTKPTLVQEQVNPFPVVESTAAPELLGASRCLYNDRVWSDCVLLGGGFACLASPAGDERCGSGFAGGRNSCPNRNSRSPRSGRVQPACCQSGKSVGAGRRSPATRQGIPPRGEATP